MTIPLFRVAMSPNAGAALAETLASGYVGEGEKVAEFERRLPAVLGIPEPPVTVNSCTAAIDLALHLCGVNVDLYGDRWDGKDWEKPWVISTPMTCTATNGSIVNRGAEILWADIDPVTGLISPESVRRTMRAVETDVLHPHFGSKPKAIIAVDWGGRSCDYAALRRAAPGIPIIEDAAHRLSVGPDHGDYVCWSFGPIKHLCCGGYGGALLPPADQDARARLLRWHGLDRTSSADFRCAQTIHEAGYRYHLTDDLATVGLANLTLAQANVGKARENARWYDRVLRGVPGITLQPFDPDAEPWLFTVLTDDRAGLIAHLAAHGIASSPVHARNDVHPAYSFPNGPLPGVDAFASRELAIPVGWWVGQQEREQVAAAVIDWTTARPAPVRERELVTA